MMFRKHYRLVLPAISYFSLFVVAMFGAPSNLALTGSTAMAVFLLIFVGFPVALALAFLAFTSDVLRR